MCVHGHIHVTTYMWRSKDTLTFWSSPSTLFETKVSFFPVVLARLTSPQALGSSHPPHLLMHSGIIGMHITVVTEIHACAWLFLGSGALNSGSQACSASSLTSALTLLTPQVALGVTWTMVMSHLGSCPLLSCSHLLSWAQLALVISHLFPKFSVYLLLSRAL